MKTYATLFSAVLLTHAFLFHISANAADAELSTDVSTESLLKQLKELERKVELLSAKTITSQVPSQKLDKNWQIISYGSIAYSDEAVFRNIQDTEGENKATVDLERVVLEVKYQPSDKWQIETEIEFEHGGTGSAIEYDGFEEFGEFETEVEAGGEVLVEKIEFKYTYNDMMSVKFGHISVPVGLGTEFHKPSEYLTTKRHWSEATLIPQTWHETGVNLLINWQNLHLQTLVTTGLNSEYFRTYDWIASGQQQRFEYNNADNLALTVRLDYGDIKNESGIGLSYYTGNTSGNRHNDNNISGDGKVSILGLHAVWRSDNVIVKSQYLLGNLEDSELITQANKTTSGLQPGNFALIGSEAHAGFIEAGYHVNNLFNIQHPITAFVAYSFANPVKETQSSTATERFDTSEIAFGINYTPVKNIVIKSQFAIQQYASESIDDTGSFGVSVGYQFSI
jgi:hypothetical protein